MSPKPEPAPLLRLFAGVGLALGMGSFDGAAVQGIFPYLAGGLSTSSDHALWALTYFIVHWSLGISLMPWTTARFGPRRVFLAATVVAAVGSLMSASTSNLWIMLLARSLQGLAAGLLVPLSQSLFLRYTRPERHGLVTVFWSNAMLMPFFFGPAIGGWLAVGPGYRWIFALSLPLWLLAAWLGRGGIPDRPGDPKTPPFDWFGFLLLYAGLMALQVTLDQGETYGWWHSRFILCTSLAAGIFLLLFAWWEGITRYPLLRFHFFRRRNYWLGLLLLCLGWSLFMGWASVFPLWAEDTLGFNGFWGSMVLLPIGVGAIPISTLMDRLRTLLGLRRLASLCFLTLALAWGSARLSPDMSLSDLFLPIWLMGLGVGMLFVPLTLILLSGIPPDEIPSATTTSNFIRVFSANIGVSLISVYWTRGSASAASPLRADITPWNQHSTLPLWLIHRHLEALAATLSLDNLLRFSSALAVVAALVAYVFLISPRRLQAPGGAASYVEELEEESSETAAAKGAATPGAKAIS